MPGRFEIVSSSRSLRTVLPDLPELPQLPDLPELPTFLNGTTLPSLAESVEPPSAAAGAALGGGVFFLVLHWVLSRVLAQKVLKKYGHAD